MDLKELEELKSKTYWKNAEIPIVIGVSAHRKIEENYIDAIRQKVEAVIDFFLEEYPHTPVLMLNGLAKGGDLLCADVARKKFEAGKPVRLCAVFPEERQIYLEASSDGEADFSAEDKEKFNEIINFETENGRFVIGEDVVAPDMEQTGNKSRQYKFRQQAIYVATKCHVLLALWDGNGAKGEQGKGIKNTDCGTAAAVNFALIHNYKQPYGTEFYSAYDGAVIKILSPRKGQYDKDAGKLTYLTPENGFSESKDFPKKLKEVLIRTNLFNKNYHAYCKKQKKISEKKGENNGGQVIPEGSFLIGREEYEKGGEKQKRIHDCCKIASELSKQSKEKYHRFLSALAVLGFMLLAGFMLYDQLNTLWTVILFLVLLVILIIGYLLLKSLETQHVITWLKLKGKPCGIFTKSIEYRALSETLRVQYYLSACGIYYNAGNNFTWSHKNGIVWVKKAVTALFICKDRLLWETDGLQEKYSAADVGKNQEKLKIKLGKALKEKSVCLDMIFSKWVGKDMNVADKKINGQIGYHLENKSDLKGKLKKFKALSAVVTAVTLAAYLALFVLELCIRLNCITQVDLDKNLFLIINGRMLFKIFLCLLSAAAFALTYFYGKMSLNRKISDSENMYNLFGIAVLRAEAIFGNDELYRSVEDKERAFGSLLKELAREQIIENGVWISYSRENDIDLPV